MFDYFWDTRDMFLFCFVKCGQGESMDGEQHHILQMFEEDSNDDNFPGFTSSGIE